jgi:hypothetical protein
MLRPGQYGDTSTAEAEGRIQKSQDEVQQIGTVGAMSLASKLHVNSNPVSGRPCRRPTSGAGALQFGHFTSTFEGDTQ